MGSTADTQCGKVIDVAIVGYGPVGVTLAGLLGRMGLGVAAFDKATDIYPQPRAVGFDHDAMRIFQQVGVADALLPHMAPFNDGIYYGIGGRVIRRMQRMPPPYPQGWAPGYTCDQPGVEAVLREAVARMPNVAVKLGVELTGFTQSPDAVQLTLRDANGKEEQCTARYLVGCDGASSPIRRGLGIGLESFDYDHAWVVVDVKVKPEHLAQLPSTNVQYCQPERPSTFITCPGNHRRWEFMTLPGEERDGEVPEERLWELLSRWLKPGEAEIWRSAAYRFHALVANDWRQGRVLLAGDAAHQTPPFLGQGMCQGLRDAGNLAWKLEAVLRERAPSSLLDSYTEERRPHVVETTRLAKEFGYIISERDPDKARARDEAMLALGGGEPQTLIRQELIPGLTSGLIAAEAPLAGKVCPQPTVRQADAQNVRLDDVTGPRWCLLVTGAPSPDLVAAARSHDAIIVTVGAASIDGALQVMENDGLLTQWLAAAGCRGALVRPDHYVFGGFASDDEARSLLDQFASTLQATPPNKNQTAQQAA
jgi:3-(3-hydroxy-phenyl)propionate hydroxylase